MALEKVEGRVQTQDPIPIAKEKDKDIHSCLSDITERSKFLAELVLIERRQAEAGQEAREAAEKAREEMADRLATQQNAWEAKRTALLAQLEESTRGKQQAEQQLVAAEQRLAATLQEKDLVKKAHDQKEVEC